MVATYTKTGNKGQAQAKLSKKIFDIDVNDHELLNKAYRAYLANGRVNLAQAKTRGEVRGGGRKPWRQKGTGRARFGSSRNPIWRGGGITFGPTGNENYKVKLSAQTKRTALRQALSLAAKEDKIKIIETFECKSGKVSDTLKLFKKIESKGNILLAVSIKDLLVERATRNIQSVKAIDIRYLSVFDVLNADTIIIDEKALSILNDWLGVKK